MRLHGFSEHHGEGVCVVGGLLVLIVHSWSSLSICNLYCNLAPGQSEMMAHSP